MGVLGPQSIHSSMEDVIGAINQYLKEETSCQQDSEPRSADTQNIGTKHRWISDTVADLIATLAQLFGEQFGQLFGQIFQNLLFFGREIRHSQDQAMVVGCIADCCSRLTEDKKKMTMMSPFSSDIYKLSLRVAGSEDVNMRQNALYCMGAVSACCDTNSNMAHSQAVLQCIKKYIELPKNGERAHKLVRDNAVSALGKMLISEPTSLPTKELLPVFLNALPLTGDFSENKYVYEVVIRFIMEQQSYVQPHIEQALTSLGMALADKEVEEDTKKKIAECLKKICSDSNIQQIVQSKVSQTAKENIMKAVNH